MEAKVAMAESKVEALECRKVEDMEAKAATAEARVQAPCMLC